LLIIVLSLLLVNIDIKDYHSVANIIFISKNPDLIDTCVICLENFDTNSSLAELNCDHNYHFNCLDKWINCGHDNCPLCRLSIKSKIY